MGSIPAGRRRCALPAAPTAGTVPVVSQGGILNMALRAMLGIPIPANFMGAYFRFGNAGFAVPEYLPACLRWHVERVNDRAHWPVENTD